MRRGKENGEEGGESVYSQPGIKADGDSRHNTEDGFPSVSKGRVPRNKGRDFQATKGDYQKGLGHAPPCIQLANAKLTGTKNAAEAGIFELGP